MTVRAPGKAMLIGEYAVLDGAPAVVAAVDCYAVATLDPAAEAAPGSAFIAEAMRVACAALQIPALRSAPVVDTAAFSLGGRKLGLGSSAAATVAAVGAIYAASGRDPAACAAEIERVAAQAHAAAQGVPGSGADVIAAARGGLQVLAAPRPPGPLPAELRFVATSQSAATGPLVRRYREAGAAVRPATAELAAAAHDFLSAWRDQSWPALLRAVERAAAGYLALGRVLDVTLLTAEHAAIGAAARLVGGVAKPSGAGGGDLAIVFLPTGRAAATLPVHLPPGVQVLPLRVSPTGVDGAPVESPRRIALRADGPRDPSRRLTES